MKTTEISISTNQGHSQVIDEFSRDRTASANADLLTDLDVFARHGTTEMHRSLAHA